MIKTVLSWKKIGQVASAARPQRRGKGHADEDGSLDENAVARGSRRRGRWQQTFRDVVGWMEEGR